MTRPVIATIAVPGASPARNTKTLVYNGEPLRGDHVLAYKSNWGTTVIDQDFGENHTAWTNNGECRNKAYYRKLRDKFGLSTVRVLIYRDIRSLYPTNWFPFMDIIPVLDDIKTILAELGMVGIWDYHPVPCGRRNWSTENPTTGHSDAYLPSGFTNFQVDCHAFWDYVAPRYKNDEHIIYECMNESYGPWGADNLANFYAETAALNWHDSIYARIRALAPNTPILNYSIGQARGYESSAKDMLDVFSKTGVINYTNSLVAFHGYSESKPSVERLAATLPAIMSEYVDASNPPVSWVHMQKHIDYWESIEMAWIALNLEWNSRNLTGNLNVTWPIPGGGGGGGPVDKTFYVAKTGVDSAGTAGTFAAPWQSIVYGVGRCAADLAAGSAVTLLVRGGVYQEEILITVSGTSNTKRLTIKAFEGELVYIDGRADLTIEDPAFGSTNTAAWNAGGRNRVLPDAPVTRCSIRYADRCFHSVALVRLRGEYITVDGLNVRYSKGRGFHAGGQALDDLKGYNKIINCTIDRVYSNGITTLFSHHTEVAYCEVTKTGDYAPYDRLGTVENWPGALALNQCTFAHVHHNNIHDCWAEGILVNTGADDALVEHNFIWRCFRDQLYHNRCHRVITRFNVVYYLGDDTFFSNGDRALGLSFNNEPNTADVSPNSSDLTVYGNLVVNMKHNLIVQAGANGLHPFTNTKIFFNTFVDAVLDNVEIASCCKCGGGVHLGTSFIKNNVFVQDNGQGVIANISTAMTGMVFSNNAWSTDPALATATHGELAVGSGDAVGDVGLLNRTAAITAGAIVAANYAKIAESIGINMGAVIPGSYTDYFGKQRANPVDAGFDEWPPEDVGPPDPPPPDPDPEPTASGQVAVGITFSSVSTASGDFDLTSTNLGGVTAKAGLFFTTEAVTANTAVAYSKFSVGAAAQSSQWVLATRSRDASATITVHSRGATTDVALVQANSSGSTIDFRAAFSSWITNGARLNKAATQTTGAGMTAVLFGGSDVTAKAFTVALSSSINGTVTVDMGFPPSLMFFAKNNGVLNDVGIADNGLTIGLATSVANQFCIAQGEDSGVTPTSLTARGETGFIGRALTGPVQWWEITNITGNIVTITTRNAAGAATMAGLALGITGLECYVGSATTPTSTGSVSTELPFEPLITGFFNTHLAAMASTKTDGTAGVVGVGFANATEQHGVAIAVQDNVATGNTQAIYDTKVMNVPKHDGTTGLVGTATLTTTGYQIAYSSVLTTVARHLVFAIEKPLVATRAKIRRMGQGMGLGMRAGF